MKLFKLYFPLLLLLFPLFLAADDFPERPNPPQLVNDFVGILSSSEVNNLEHELVNFNRETSTQIALVIVGNLNGYDPADYTTRLAEKWKIGQKGKDNGILIMIKPTGNSGDRHAYIAIGYGLEGVIPDAIANRIVDNEMIPQFKIGNYFNGISKAVSIIKSLSLKEFSATDYQERTSSFKSSNNGTARGLFIILVMLLFFFIKPGSMARRYSKANNIGFWAAFMIILTAGRSSNDDHWNNFHGGRGGFGGFGGGGFGGSSGGGFGGFGGGSFGGGGAGGSW